MRWEKQFGEWHRWFAWRPLVFIKDFKQTIVWLEFIERRHVMHDYDVYRLPERESTASLPTEPKAVSALAVMQNTILLQSVVAKIREYANAGLAEDGDDATPCANLYKILAELDALDTGLAKQQFWAQE